MEIHYFAAARAAAGTATDTVEGVPGTLRELVDKLALSHSGTTEAGMSFAEVLERCTFLIDGRSAHPADSLEGARRVDVLPPFAGG